ncbi:MAG: cytosine deaminase, partial [Ilumatobacteraceae bacterium]
WRAGYRHDADIERCVDIATSRGAAAIGVSDHGIAPGCRGDVVLVDVASRAEAAVTRPARLAVVKAGRITTSRSSIGNAG